MSSFTSTSSPTCSKLCEREGSTLSGDLRKAYDLKPLGNLTREHGDRTAEGYFLGAIGSITPAELRHLLDEVSIENGFANRWLLLHCEISHAMPRGDTIDDDVVKELAGSVIGTIGGSIGSIYRITDDLAEVWDPFYVERRTGMLDESPLVRVFAHRQPAHAARLATAFAAIDGATALRPADIEAAIAWCDYSLDTVRFVFGDGATGDAGKLLDGDPRRGVQRARRHRSTRPVQPEPVRRAAGRATGRARTAGTDLDDRGADRRASPAGVVRGDEAAMTRLSIVSFVSS